MTWLKKMGRVTIKMSWIWAKDSISIPFIIGDYAIQLVADV